MRIFPHKLKNWFMISVRLSSFIIQHIDTLPKYGKKLSMYIQRWM